MRRQKRELHFGGVQRDSKIRLKNSQKWRHLLNEDLFIANYLKKLYFFDDLEATSVILEEGLFQFNKYIEEICDNRDILVLEVKQQSKKINEMLANNGEVTYGNSGNNLTNKLLIGLLQKLSLNALGNTTGNTELFT